MVLNTLMILNALFVGVKEINNMTNQNYITIVVHEPMTGMTHFEQIRGMEMEKHIERELSVGRKRYKRLTKQI